MGQIPGNGLWGFDPMVLLGSVTLFSARIGESAPSMPLILLVDDSQDDVMLIRKAFERAGLKHPITSVSNGDEAIAYLNGDPPYGVRANHPLPQLVLLDIKMPRTDGFAVLRWIREQREFAKLCVVMLTSSDAIRDANQAYQLGATSFLVKPLDFWNAAELTRSVGKLLAKC
jgi:CheY-like chemotaxis protein